MLYTAGISHHMKDHFGGAYGINYGMKIQVKWVFAGWLGQRLKFEGIVCLVFLENRIINFLCN
jgi:hypothetical protein